MKKLLLSLTFTSFFLAAPTLVFAGATDSIFNPISFPSLGDLLSKALPIIFALVALFAVVVFAIGALRYLSSQGDPKAIDGARGTMTGAVIGLIIVFGAASVSGVFERIFGISFFGTTQTGNGPDPRNAVDLACAFKLTTGNCIGDQFHNFGELITFILLLIISVGALVFFFMLVWGGIRYMLSRGDEKAVMAARGVLTSAFIGLLLMISALVIIRLITAVLFKAGNLVF